MTIQFIASNTTSNVADRSAKENLNLQVDSKTPLVSSAVNMADSVTLSPAALAMQAADQNGRLGNGGGIEPPQAVAGNGGGIEPPATTAGNGGGIEPPL